MFFFFGKEKEMVLKKTITDEEFLEIAADIINKKFCDLNENDVLTMGLYAATIAAIIFSDGEEVLSTMVTNQYIVGDYKYNVTTGGDVGEEYRLTIQTGHNMIARKTFSTEAQALEFIIKHTANHQRTTI